MKVYNLDATITLISTKSRLLTTANNNIVNRDNSDGTTTHTHLCQIRPKLGINECNYMLDVTNGAKWSWVLNSWNFA